MTNNIENNKLVIRDLSVTMGKKIILDHVDFEVKDGEFLSILGPSGCGKTTVLSLMGKSILVLLTIGSTDNPSKSSRYNVMSSEPTSIGISENERMFSANRCASGTPRR